MSIRGEKNQGENDQSANPNHHHHHHQQQPPNPTTFNPIHPPIPPQHIRYIIRNWCLMVAIHPHSNTPTKDPKTLFTIIPITTPQPIPPPHRLPHTDDLSPAPCTHPVFGRATFSIGTTHTPNISGDGMGCWPKKTIINNCNTTTTPHKFPPRLIPTPNTTITFHLYRFPYFISSPAQGPDLTIVICHGFWCAILSNWSISPSILTLVVHIAINRHHQSLFSHPN